MPIVSALNLVLQSPSVYTFSGSGAPAGALVDDGEGGFVITPGSTDYDGQAFKVGAGVAFTRGVPFPEADPTSLAHLLAWGEGDDLGADASVIASWTNRTGSGLDPAQSTSAKPTVKAGAIRGHKAARFTSASSQFLSFPAGSLGWFNGVAGATIIAVIQPVTVVSSFYLDVSKNGAVSPDRLALQTSSTPLFRVAALANNDSTNIQVNSATVVPVAGTPIIHAVVVDWAGGTIKQYLNGALDGSAAITGPTSAATNSQEITIGGRSTGNYTNSDVGSYAMYGAAYTRAQLDPVFRRWSRKYAIPLLA